LGDIQRGVKNFEIKDPNWEKRRTFNVGAPDSLVWKDPFLREGGGIDKEINVLGRSLEKERTGDSGIKDRASFGGVRRAASAQEALSDGVRGGSCWSRGNTTEKMNGIKKKKQNRGGGTKGGGWESLANDSLLAERGGRGMV